MMRRTTFREIKNTFGRFVAIMAIIALGVGFFSGLKMTKPDMVNTVSNFLDKENFYDLHLLSTLGFTDDDVDAFAEEKDVLYAEGSYSVDVLYKNEGENDRVLKTISVPENVNKLRLVDGHLPESADECMIDAKMGDVKIGDTIEVSDENTDSTKDMMKTKTFTVVGTVNSPLYINFERGTTTLGNGRIAGFVYISPEAVDSDVYTDVYVAFDQSYDIYDDAYDDYMDDKKDEWDSICETRVLDRYKDILMSKGMTKEMVKDVTLADAEGANYYILGRETNIGYVCFESDSDIVNGVAKVFPVFFILVAVLVCMTTMNRMVEEQRSMIGMLKALGYGEAAIMGKYMIYSGTAAVVGCVGGYLIGTYVFPEVIWYAYHLMYLNIPLERVTDWTLVIIVLAASLMCTVGTTWFSCRYELSETAASLMRPKAPKPGKRVLLERIPFIWKRLKFLKKVSVRNIFRYKKRFFMMIIGISGCTALLLTGFGINDSISGFADNQYEEIQVGDGVATLSTAMSSEDINVQNDAEDEAGSAIEMGEPGDSTMDGQASGSATSLTDLLESDTSCYDFVSESSWDLVESDGIKSVNMVIMEKPENVDKYMKFADKDGNKIDYPGDGEAVINNALADLYDLKVGDDITVRNSDMEEINVTISGIFRNHVYNYVYISPDTYETQMGEAPEYKSVYFNLKDGADAHEISADLMDDSNVVSVTMNKDMKERISKMMKSLNYIVLVVILSAGALAFIVLYNLTNINITERIREIATIKVLGFFRNETSAYVFRENRVLTAFGIIVGLGLGILLHGFVIGQIKVDMVSFDTYIAPMSYVYSIVLTFVFNFLVNRIMSVRLEKINMAESLKSVE